jgi:glycosyltransferase involved in cell wall biosynthesis
MPTPYVSVIMPYYNAGRFIAQAIESILAQTFTDFEVLLINDGSTDASEEILQLYSNDPRLVFVRNERNCGVAAALNTGLRVAKGVVFARMDADDLAAPQRLEKQVDYLSTHPDCILCGTDVVLIDANQRVIGTRQFPHTDHEIKRQLLRVNPFCHPTVCLPATIVRQYGLQYSAEFPRAEDYHFWLRLASYGQFVNLPEKLLQWRYSAHSIRLAYSKEMLSDTIRLKWRYRHYGNMTAWFTWSCEVLAYSLPLPWLSFLYKHRFHIGSRY